MKVRKTLAAAGLFAAFASFAETTPVMVSLVTPVQAPSREYDVRGFRLSLIYGDCADFSGLDIGIANHVSRELTGIAIGGVNISNGRMRGGQVGLVNWNGNGESAWGSRSTGAQVGLLNCADSFCGLQDGLVNVATGSFAGLQTSFLNVSGDLSGAQIGCYFFLGVNVADMLRGCQIGLVNYAASVDSGMQIGLVNIIARNGWAPVLPIVNGHF